MADLNAVLYYKAKFSISAGADETDLLWRIIMMIRKWMVNKWKKRGETLPGDNTEWSRWKNGSFFTSENKIVSLSSVYCREEDLRENWACRIMENQEAEAGVAPREWVTEVGFRKRSEEAAEFSLVISYQDRPGFLGLCQPEPAPDAGVPGLVRMLLNADGLHCTVGKAPISLCPEKVTPESYAAFRSFVLDPARELMAVYISPRRREPDSESTELPLDPETLANILGPNARVYYADSLDVSRAISADEYSNILGCYSGGLRCFMPQPQKDEEGEAARHRYLTGTFLREQGQKNIYSLLRRALAQDNSFYRSCFREEDCTRLIRMAQLRHEQAAHRERIEEELLSDSIKEENKWKNEIDSLTRIKEELEHELIGEMEQEEKLKNELIQSKQRAGFAERRLEEQEKKLLGELREGITDYPGDAEKVAAFFLCHYRDRIAFTQRGLDSLKECGTDPQVLWNCFHDIVHILYDLYYCDSSLNISAEFNSRSRFEFARGEGRMTRKDSNLMQQYSDSYEGRSIDVESHIKNGVKEKDPRFFRVYLGYDNTAQKLVISHVGAHLANYTTQKIH